MGTGGANVGTGGSSSGSGGSSGTTVAQLPFPQSQKPPGCALTSVANAASSSMQAYKDWMTYVTATGAGGNLRVVRPNQSSDTVSEGIGYGMIAAAYIGDKTTFDGLWNYAQAHFDANGLMNWHIDSSGNAIQSGGKDPGSASDADEDMAWALIVASHQWSSSSYLDGAKSLIGSIRASSLGSDGMIHPGDSWGSGDVDNFPDYFSPAYYRVFATVTNSADWSGLVIDRGYAILAGVEGNDGLVPDQITAMGTTYAPSTTNCTIGSGSTKNCANYGYDACRTPWRIGMDYCFNPNSSTASQAQTYLMKVGGFFNGIGAANIADGYTAAGTMSVTNANHNMAFIGPAGIAGMAASFPTLLDGAFNFGVTNKANDYYKDSLRVITMLMMSGNFIDVGAL
jgi:endo-1,4-beta-D-glucanase Y